MASLNQAFDPVKTIPTKYERSKTGAALSAEIDATFGSVRKSLLAFYSSFATPGQQRVIDEALASLSRIEGGLHMVKIIGGDAR